MSTLDGKLVRPQWSAERAERVKAGLRRRARRRPHVVAASFAGVCILAVSFGLFAQWAATPISTPQKPRIIEIQKDDVSVRRQPATEPVKKPAMVNRRPAEDAVGRLLAEADTLRAQHREGDALGRLETIASRYASDYRAPLAAFTAGKILQQLQRCDEARRFFVLTRTLAPEGPLVSDALAREKECR